MKRDKSRDRPEPTKVKVASEATKHRVGDLDPLNPFTPFTDTQLSALNKTFKANTPFPYLSMENFVDDKLLEKVFTEIYSLEFFEKSNDLFHF